MASTISTANSTAAAKTIRPAGIPRILLRTAGALAVVAAIPAAVLGGADQLAHMALGNVVALASVLGGWWLAKLAFRGPDRFATKLVVGGFVTRMVLLFGFAAVIVTSTGADPSAFVLWLVSFYFALILVEAWVLARQPLENAE